MLSAGKNRVAGLFLIALLGLELFAPFAFAQTNIQISATAGTPTQPQPAAAGGVGSPVPQQTAQGAPYIPGVCEPINELTPDQARLFWSRTQRFRGDEINALQDGELAANRPSQNVRVDVVVRRDQGEAVYPFTTIARHLELNDRQRTQALQLLHKEETDRISEEEAKTLARRFNKDVEGLGDFFASLQGTSAEETPAYENYKIRLLNGAEIPVASGNRALDPRAACMINSHNIKGRVSYIASLADDLAVSFDRSPTNLNKKNKLWSRETNADLDLQGASTLIIPFHYAEFAKRIKKWIYADLASNLGQMAYFFGGKEFLERKLNAIEEIRKTKRELQVNSIVYQNLNNYPLKKEVFGLAFRREATAAEMSQAITRIEDVVFVEFGQPIPAAAQRQQAIAQLTGANPAAGAKFDVLNSFRTEVNVQGANPYTVYQRYKEQLNVNVGGLNREEITEIEKALHVSQLEQREVQLVKDAGGQNVLHADLDVLKRKLQLRTGDFWVRVALGMSWLGPGRFIFELADAINFPQISGRQFADNYMIIFANNDDVAGEFRRTTNLLTSGFITDTISDLTEEGVPTAAYSVGNLKFVNQPVDDQEQTIDSTTSFYSTGSGWRVNAEWSGKSDVWIGEELTKQSEYARLPMEVKGKAWGVKIRAKREFETFYKTLIYIAPLVTWRILGSKDYLATATRLVVYDYYVTDVVNPNSFRPGEACSMEKVEEYADMFAIATGANIAIGWSPIFFGWLKTTKTAVNTLIPVMEKTRILSPVFLNKYGNSLVKLIDPVLLGQIYFASKGFEYVSSCKDDQYTIVAFHSLKKRSTSGLSDQLTGVSGNDILSRLNVGRALQGVGQEIQTANLREYVNIKAELNDQKARLEPAKIYGVHIKDGEVQWAPSFRGGQGRICEQICWDSDDASVCSNSQRGLEHCDKKTGECVTLANPTRASNYRQFDRFAATLIPNRYITSSIAGCGPDAFQVDSSRNLYLTAPSTCAGAECIRAQLEYLTGRQIARDLTPVLGGVREVRTTKGSATIGDGIIRFYVDTPARDEVAELRSPSIDALSSASTAQESSFKSAAALNVASDGKVRLSGYIGENAGDEDVGELISIITDRGVVNYLGNGQVQIFLHVLTQVDASLIRDIQTQPVQADQCADSGGAPSIKIARVTGQPGAGDQAAQELNAALQKIQGCGGVYELETKDHKYLFTTDENGNPVLRVIDKNTGEVKDYRITGPLRQEGNQVIVPTDKGDFKFAISNENGQPTLTAEGPDELKELLPLLAARGLGGVLLFDPRTGQWGAFNGQDLQLNPNFATRGQTLTAGSDGTVRGQPSENFLSPSRSKRRGGANPLAALPSWPEQTLPALLLVALAVAGVAIVRWKAK